jgi:hypothetical protein
VEAGALALDLKEKRLMLGVGEVESNDVGGGVGIIEVE